jgi:ubiquinone/menaquinone biosynthesis C-methylase UbiE
VQKSECFLGAVVAMGIQNGNRGKDDSETDFAPVVPFYSGRVPYVSEFFRTVVSTLALQRDSFIMDFACGTGELACGFSPHCRAILAMDKSAAMISACPKDLANVSFKLVDLNSDLPAISELADLVVIGRAIHLLSRESLLPKLECVTKKGATVLVCGAGLTRDNPWFKPYRTLLGRYGFAGLKAERSLGLDVFVGTPWLPSITDIVVYSQMKWSVRDLLRHGLSYSSCSTEILNARDMFESELERILAPHFDGSKHVDAKLVNWGMPYMRSGTDRAGAHQQVSKM